VRKAFLSPTAAPTQQGWSSLCKLKLLNTIITLFYGTFAIRGLVGSALRYCHKFQLDPFLVANKTYLSASDLVGIRWPRPLYYGLTGLFPSIQNSKLQNSKQPSHTKQTTTQAPTVLAKRLSQQSTTSTSLFIQVVTCTVGITLE